MSDKAGSDLDVFDSLAAKKPRPSSMPAASRAPAPPPSSATRQKTLLGLAAPQIPGVARPGSSPVPPPPSGGRPPAPPSALATPPPISSKPPGFPAPSTGSAPHQLDALSAPPPLPGIGSSPLSAPPPPPIPGSSALQRAPSPPPPAPRSGDENEHTPVVTVPTAAAASGKSEIDWDDEDEATMIFDRSIEDTARALLRSGPPPPPPAAGSPPPPPPPVASLSQTMRLSSSAPPGALRNTLPPVSSRSVAPPVARSGLTQPLSAPPTSSVAPRAPLPPPPTLSSPAPTSSAAPADALASGEAARLFGQRWVQAVGLVLVLGVLGAVAFVLLPKKGSLVVTVAGPNNRAIDSIEVYVDDVRSCNISPCRVPNLRAGTHLLKVNAPGYQPTANRAVKISSGEEEVQNVVLQRASEGTGLRAISDSRGLRLSVDGKDVGPLPQELKDLTPGEHLVRIDGGERYESFEKRVTVEPEQMLTLDPKLKVKKGLATIRLGENAEDAKVLLVSGNERRPLPALPLTVDIQVDKPYSIVATKHGFSDYEERISFEDGQAERTFVVNMKPAPVAATALPAPMPAPYRPAPAPAPAPAPKPAPAAAAGGAKLNINSIPISNIVLDGRPLGQTPKVGINVNPGPHTVVFISADYGRKTKVVNVEAGRTAAAIVRFP